MTFSFLRLLKACAASLFCVAVVGCAPATSPRASVAHSPLSAAASAEGVVWAAAGEACVARQPSLERFCPRLPAPATLVAWHGAEAWAFLPSLGLLVTLDGPPKTVAAGRVTALSSKAIYREDGSALNYQGQPLGFVAGGPQSAITGRDGQDYVILAGQLRRVSDGAILEKAALPFLVAGAEQVYTAALPLADGGPLGRKSAPPAQGTELLWVGWAGSQAVLLRGEQAALAQQYQLQRLP